jgi:diacylglycerol O-acyltransferase / trehalose O-mycolyltransferase
VTPITRALAAVTAVLALAVVPTAGAVPSSGTPAARAADEGPVTVVSVDPRRDQVAAVAAYARLMALPSVDTGIVPDVRAPREGGGEACPPRRCHDFTVPAPRGVRVSDETVRVLVPPGYAAPRNRAKRYPVVFLWNGGQSRSDGWTWKTELTRMSRSWQAILVMPEGGFGKAAGYFSDWADGSYDWETWHIGTVVPWVDRTFRTVRGARASVGASMGAIGAVAYAARHRGMFKAALSISGALDTTAMRAYAVDPALSGALGYDDVDLRRIWGDPVLDHATWQAHNPAALVPRLRGVHLLLTSGTGYPGLPGGDVYNGTFENTLWNTQRTFLAQLTRHRLPYEARVMVGGVHDWPWFNHPLRWGMPKLIRATLR